MESSKLSDASSTRRSSNPFDTLEGYSGQDYHRDREAEWARQHPSGEKLVEGGPADLVAESADPPEAGRAASFDPRTGRVQGSGSGAGGGNAGEDHDEDPKAGAGYPATGAPGEAGVEAAQERNARD